MERRIGILFVLIGVLLVGGCRPKEKLTLYFDANGGSVVEAIVDPAAMSPLVLPTPVKDGFVFGGWYLDKQLSALFTAESELPTFSITLYAKWIEGAAGSVTITFISNGGTSLSPLVQVSGTVVSAPVSPTRSGYVFAGWYQDAALTNAYTFSTMPSSNLTLYAKWTTVSSGTFTITFDSNGGTAVSALSASHNESIVAPDPPVKSGHTFAGWYQDAALTQPFVFNVMPGSSFTLYARWVEGSVLTLASASDLAMVRGNPTAHFLLSGNIDLGNAEWDPIGTFEVPFEGLFDGGGYTISNFTITSYKNEGVIGLFGHVRGTIKNLKIDDAVIQFSTNQEVVVGLLAGRIEYGEVINVEVDGDIIIQTNTVLDIAIGGLVGRNAASWFTDCTSHATISLSTNNENASTFQLFDTYIGGLIGYGYDDYLLRATSDARITLREFGSPTRNQTWYATNIGGLIGKTDDGLIEYGVSQVDIITHLLTSSASTGYFLGGITGYLNRGEILYSESVGWIAPDGVAPGAKVYLGGIAGYQMDGLIKNCTFDGGFASYAEGVENAIVTGGGIVAVLNEGEVRNCWSRGEFRFNAPGNDGVVIAGGLVGRMWWANIHNNFTTASLIVTSNPSYLLGRLVAEREDSNIYESYKLYTSTFTVNGSDITDNTEGSAMGQLSDILYWIRYYWGETEWNYSTLNQHPEIIRP